jgi:hypothetical protein
METSEVRRRPASYAVRGDECLDRTFPLDDGESIVGRGAGRAREGRRDLRADYRVSTTSLCVVTHRRLRHGEATSIPRASIRRVEGPDDRGRVTIRLDDGTVLVLTPATSEQAVALVDALSA